MKAWIKNLPKIELHIHLEGAIPPEILWELVKKYGQGKTIKSKDEIIERFRFRDFAHFIETWVWKNGFIREYDDFTLLASGAAQYLKSQNIVYSEMHYSPSEFQGKGLSIPGITESIRKGLSITQETEVSLICDVVRDLGPDEAIKTLRVLDEMKDPGVIGIGLGGREKEFPPQLFAGVFRKARELGFHVTAHAGEAAGEESIRGAVEILSPERIGHGTKLKDPQLIDLIKQRNIGIEMCPLSNLRTNSIKTLQEHPLGRLYREGLLVSLNPDDPAMFGNPLNTEFETAVETFGFTKADCLGLVLNAIETSWAVPDKKDALKKRLAEYNIDV